MRHVDAEVLALVALGEPAPSQAELDHLLSCRDCAAELAILKRTARVGRTTLGAELVHPPEEVWNRIAQEVGLSTVQAGPAERRRSLPWWRVVTVAAAASLVVSGAIVAAIVLRPWSAEPLETASLEAFPEWPGATGEATVNGDGDGGRAVTVRLDAALGDDQYQEVWLITSDATQLISLGIIDGTGGEFAIPDGLDLTRYTLVDISAEPYDGDPGHSGNSIVRGELGT